ncbi:extracellular solute-binding protein [Pelagibacterium montanilacus]|uniref:extracellular solute-binding protein n=1 Tax=Pelagibacterium montanilacus TaxID=2185280 RepID=UPI000F8DE436|nr:extracellular solute-binding protein [Pelagibacterium montanilacus]
MTISLKGMTWSHPRGYDPMVACSTLFAEKTGISVTWDKRSLQDFESFPVEDLARQYDLIVIDHPHVGQITREGCLTRLDVPGREAERAEMAAHSVGQSYPSYTMDGAQWAFPIDAASQVQAFRPDLVDAAPTRYAAVLELAREGRVALPLRAPHAILTFFTLAANMGLPCTTGPGPLIAPEDGEKVYETLAELVALIDPASFEMDPIEASEAMARADSRLAVMPFAYGYVNYAIAGFRERVLGFADIPAAGDLGPTGGTLGGTGIAVSAFSAAPDAAIDFAYWIAGASVQAGPYAAAGGQPGHGLAWEDAQVNAATANFYRNTRETLERAYVRPRHDGYMGFQQAGSDRLHGALKASEAAGPVIADLNRLYAESRAED